MKRIMFFIYFCQNTGNIPFTYTLADLFITGIIVIGY